MIAVFGRIAKQHKRMIAVTGSVLLHVLALWALINPLAIQSGVLSAENSGAQDGIDIDLVGYNSVQPVTPPPLPFRQFRTMVEQGKSTPVFSDPTPVPTRSLAEIFGTDTDQLSKAEASAITHLTDAKLQNDLWKQVEPCWRRLADPDSVSVTLEVSFSPMGNLSKPPAAHRFSGQRTDDRTRRSEGRAMDALAQCGPYVMAFGQQSVELRFPKGE